MDSGEYARTRFERVGDVGIDFYIGGITPKVGCL